MAYDGRIRGGVTRTEEMSSSKQAAGCSRSVQEGLVAKWPSGYAQGSVGCKEKESLKRVWCSLAVLIVYG
jgi:hypothetical protein